MTTGSGPAGEVTMDDVRQRLASISARLTENRERPAIVKGDGTVGSEPGQPTPEAGSDGQR